MICKYFLPFGRFPFHFVGGFLCHAEVFWFYEVPSACLLLLSFFYAFGVIYKKKKKNHRDQRQEAYYVFLGVIWFQVLHPSL